MGRAVGVISIVANLWSVLPSIEGRGSRLDRLKRCNKRKWLCCWLYKLLFWLSWGVCCWWWCVEGREWTGVGGGGGVGTREEKDDGEGEWMCCWWRRYSDVVSYSSVVLAVVKLVMEAGIEASIWFLLSFSSASSYVPSSSKAYDGLWREHMRNMLDMCLMCR